MDRGHNGDQNWPILASGNTKYLVKVTEKTKVHLALPAGALLLRSRRKRLDDLGVITCSVNYIKLQQNPNDTLFYVKSSLVSADRVNICWRFTLTQTHPLQAQLLDVFSLGKRLVKPSLVSSLHMLDMMILSPLRLTFDHERMNGQVDGNGALTPMKKSWAGRVTVKTRYYGTVPAGSGLCSSALWIWPAPQHFLS
ncbi:hypothetical protein EI94DRAFT_1700207 [Lactarius quietus]|nr:hypothetical protein EI94DRAFT_1700207 [Lactarius quietus]